jgi:2-polyprenyl-3-methyl-5-hydroxy-6-metoxy-1,4-benzoquinol methylase
MVEHQQAHGRNNARMSLSERLLEKRHKLAARLGRGEEAKRATQYWASLRTYHKGNEDDPLARERSHFVADTLVPELGLESLLEIGTNTGRNLGIVKQRHPDLRAKGIDVNRRALDRARRLYPEVEFVLQDANRWTEQPRSWDGVLTMSLLDHVPDEAALELARHMADSARFVICFELWDGADGERGLYKYSRDNRRLFESVGLSTLRWELAPAQYDTEHSVLWVYVGETSSQGQP